MNKYRELAERIYDEVYDHLKDDERHRTDMEAAIFEWLLCNGNIDDDGEPDLAALADEWRDLRTLYGGLYG